MDGAKPIDRRIARTKIAIQEALIVLIEEKGFDAILVSDIAERANINRGTFYLHYQDKFDLLDKAQNEIIKNIIQVIISQTHHTLNIDDANCFEKPLPVIVSLFEYFKENARLLHALLGLEGGVRFQSQIKKTFEDNIKVGFLTGMQEKDFLVPTDYLISYAMSAHIGILQNWLKKGCIESPSEMSIILSRLAWFGVIRSTGFSLK
jgi:AcrR family transcriptional regulator